MKRPSLDVLRRRPKIDLHLHLDGALRPSTIADLRRGLGMPVPRDLRRRVQVPAGCRSLSQFLATFELFYPVLKSASALERIAWELVEDQAADGVIYFETRFAPHLLTCDGFTAEDAVLAVLRGLRRGARKFGPTCRLILCAYRPLSPATSLEVVDLARRCRRAGVVGVDLAGDETHYPAKPHAAAFQRAARAGIPATVHAGEAGPAANILEAVEDLRARRIGHGVRILDNPALLAALRARGIPLEVCISSNLQTGVVQGGEHPVRTFLAEGLPVTLNTDDPGVSNIRLSGEWALALRRYGLDEADLFVVTRTAARHAFLPARARRALEARVAAGFPRSVRTIAERRYGP